MVEVKVDLFDGGAPRSSCVNAWTSRLADKASRDTWFCAEGAICCYFRFVPRVLRHYSDVIRRGTVAGNPSIMTLNEAEASDICPACEGRGRRVTLMPLLWLIFGGACLIWPYLAVTDFRHFWPRPANAATFLGALVAGPFFIWAFAARAVLTRRAWFNECSRCNGTGRL